MIALRQALPGSIPNYNMEKRYVRLGGLLIFGNLTVAQGRTLKSYLRSGSFKQGQIRAGIDCILESATGVERSNPTSSDFNFDTCFRIAPGTGRLVTQLKITEVR